MKVSSLKVQAAVFFSDTNLSNLSFTDVGTDGPSDWMISDGPAAKPLIPVPPQSLWAQHVKGF